MPQKNVTQVVLKWNLGLLTIAATNATGGAAGAGVQYRPVGSISASDLSKLCMEIANAIKTQPGTLTLNVDAHNHLIPTPPAVLGINAGPGAMNIANSNATPRGAASTKKEGKKARVKRSAAKSSKPARKRKTRGNV